MAAQNDVINADIVIVTVVKITHKHLLVWAVYVIWIE